MNDEKNKINRMDQINKYIDELFRTQFCEYYLVRDMDAKTGLWIVGMLKDEIKFNFSENDILSHEVDDKIRDIIRNILDNYPDEKIRKKFKDFRKMNEYVKDKLKDNGYLVGNNADLLSRIISIVSKNLLIFNSSKDFDNIEFDKKILVEFNKVFLNYEKDKEDRINYYKDYIIKKINDILDSRIDLIVRKIDKKDLIKYVLNEVFGNEEEKLNIFDPAINSSFNSKLNEIINKYILNFTKNNRFEDNKVEVRPNNVDVKPKSIEQEKVASNLSFDPNSMKKNSVSSAKTDEEYAAELIPFIEKLKKLAPKIVAILLVASLATGVAVVKNDKRNKKIKIVQEYGQSNLDIDDRIILVYRTLGEQEDLDVRFAGFYAEYIKLKSGYLDTSGALLKMETKFIECKEQLYNQRDSSELSKAIQTQRREFKGLNSYSFLDFVYDRLSKCGEYPVVDTEMYRNALHYYSGLVYHANEKQVKQYMDIIEDVMNMYCKFAKEKTILAGEKLEKMNTESLEDGKGMSK